MAAYTRDSLTLKKRARLYALAALLALIAPLQVFGQRLALNYTQVDATGFPKIVSWVTVTDDSGRTIGGLTKDNFSVYEDGVLQSPIVVEELVSDMLGVAVILTMDRSNSMRDEIADAQAAARTFVGLMGAKDRAALVSFADKVTVDQALTGNKDSLVTAIDNLKLELGTAMHDALIVAANMASRINERKAIILLSDGADRDSKASFEEMLPQVLAAQTPVYVVGLGINQSAHEAALQQLAATTGGRYYASATSKELEEIYRAISKLLRLHSYRITYSTRNCSRDGSERNVRIEARHQGDNASGANRYLAPLHVVNLALAADSLPVPGQPFRVRVEIPSSSLAALDLFDLRFVLQYDAQYLKIKTPLRQYVLAGALWGAASEYVLTPANNSPGALVVQIKRKAGLAPVQGRGVLAEIIFSAEPSLPDNTALRFALDNVSAKAQAGCAIPLQIAPLTLNSNGLFVWPGDTNHNGAVELTDVTVLGLHWEIAGPKRLGNEDQRSWRAHLAQRFAPLPATHADADGSGRIDERDIFPIGLNWRKTQSAPDLPKTKSIAAPEGLLTVSLAPNAPQTYVLKLVFRNADFRSANQAGKMPALQNTGKRSAQENELAGMALRMRYPASVKVIAVQSGTAWGSAPLMIKHDNPMARTMAVGLMIPNGELTKAGEGSLVEILMHAEDKPQTEVFMFNEVVMASPSGELRELGVEQEGVEQPSAMPRELILHPAYPNPFRLDDAIALQRGMRIQYDLPENAAVSVAVYNTAGQRVRLISAILSEDGRHFLNWEGLSDLGHQVSSGLYFVKVEAAGESGRAYQATQKVTVVR